MLRFKCSRCGKKFKCADNMENYIAKDDICRECAEEINPKLSHPKISMAGKNSKWTFKKKNL